MIGKVWSVRGDAWLQTALNLQPRLERLYLECVADVYDYREAPGGTLVVDFACKSVGGSCVGGGFVQEEQMVAQSAEFTLCLRAGRDTIGENEACTYEGVHMDTWWSRGAAARKGWFHWEQVLERPSQPLNIIAVDAPSMRHESKYDRYNEQLLRTLAKKTVLIFEVAHPLGAPSVYSGLLGGGACRGNRPLAMLLHLLLQTHDTDLKFHHPIFWACSPPYSVGFLERRLTCIVDGMLAELRYKAVATLEDALQVIISWGLPTSHDDCDIVKENRWQEN